MILALTLIYGLLGVDGQPVTFAQAPISACCFEECSGDATW